MTETPCIRRPHSVWTTCPCPPCTHDRNRKAKLARNGRYNRVPSDHAWAVIDQLRAKGWSGQAIASAAGVPRYTIERALTERDNNQNRAFGPTTSRKIVNHGDPVAGTVGAYAARRRLQGLAHQRYDLQTLADLTGIGFSTLAAIRNPNTATKHIRARFHTTIRVTTQRIGLTLGPSLPAQHHARTNKWPALLAWDDVEDPTETPHAAYTTPNNRDQRLYQLQHLAEQGACPDIAADALGITKDTLWKWTDNNGQRALYHQLMANRKDVA